MTFADPHTLPYEEKINELTGKVESARGKVASLEAELAWWQRGLELYGRDATPNGGARRKEPVQSNIPFRKPTLAQAIERVVADSGEPQAISQIIEALAAREWMPTGSSAHQAVRSKLSQLAQGDDAVLRRVGFGVYELNQPDAAALVSEEEP